MGKRVFSFDDYVNNRSTTNESRFGDFLSKAGGWITRMANAIKDGIIKMIPSGPKKGTPVAAYLSQENGSILSQVNDLYRGTEFAKMNPVNESSIVDIDEAQVPLEYTGADQTVRNVDADELKSLLEKLYRSKVRGGRAKPIFVYGGPGIGKTQIAAQAADKLGVDLIPLDLQFMAPEDFLGIPKVIDIEEPKYGEGGNLISPGKGVTRSNPPIVLPTDNGPEGKGGFIFMDEMNRANRSILNAIMQFVQEGRVGTYKLPDKWVIVAAGNRPEDVSGAGEVAEFDFAMADRFHIVNFVADPKRWSGWARSSGKFVPEIVDFVENNPELFHYLDTEKATLKFPTPRSWTDAAMALKDEMEDEGAESWRDLPTDTIFNIYTDSIGPMAAGKLKAYLDVIRRISPKDLEDIVKNPENAKPIPKGGDFSSVAYGVFEMALKKAEELSGGKATIQDLFNIMKYYQGLNNLEILSWIYARIREKYPEFGVNNDTLADRLSPESQLKIEAAMMVKGGMKDKGLLPN
jgi:MoxR-like ATPase